MHGATGAEWETWRVGYPLGEQAGRMGALDRLRSGLGADRAVCRERQRSERRDGARRAGVNSRH